MHVRPIQPQDAPIVARLHIEGIKTGFISLLGIDFVTALYQSIAESENSFGFVAEENSTIIGFAAFTANLNRLYKSIILKKGCHFAFLLAGKMFSLKRIGRMLETLFYPRRTRRLNMPAAELLSVAVAPENCRRGLATRLVKEGLQQCQEKGIDRIKVLVGADNQQANKLYVKCGFELAGQITSHGIVSNVYVAKTG